MPRRFALIASSLALAVVLVGCGSDDDSSDDDRETTTTAAEESTTTADAGDADEPETGETSAPDDDTTTDSSEVPETETTSPVAPGEGDPEFCAAYAAFDESFEDLPEDTVEDIQNGSELLSESLTELVGIAPEELTADMEILAQAGEDLVAAVADATTVEEAETAATEVFSDQEFSAAAERVDGYYREGCPEANDDQADG